jgi:hypothetical protein
MDGSRAYRHSKDVLAIGTTIGLPESKAAEIEEILRTVQ